MTRTQHAAAGWAAAAFLLVVVTWAGVTVAAIAQMSRLCASATACERARNWLVALAIAATLASIGLARWGARYFQRPAAPGGREPAITLWHEGLGGEPPAVQAPAESQSQETQPPGPADWQHVALRGEQRRAADVLRRLRGLQDAVLKTRRSKAG
jgi:hypothetical protein